MKRFNIEKPTINNAQIKEELKSFYQSPVAQVSSQLLATIGLVIFFAAFAIRPTILTMVQLTKDIEEKRGIDQALTQKAAALSTLSTEYYAIQNQIPVLDSSIPNVPDFDGVIRRIEKVSSENGIAFSSLRAQQLPEDHLDSATKPAVNTFTISFSAKGSFPQLKQFFDTLVGMDRFVSLDSVSFSSSVTEQDIFLNGTLNTYYYGQAQTGSK